MNRRARLHQLLCTGWFDKVVAIAMVAYSLSMTVGFIREKRGLPLVLIVLRITIHNGLLLFRRKPESITLSPGYWLIALAGAYWELLYGLARNVPSVVLLPTLVTDGLSIIAALWFLFSRVSLGRSFGVLPADRGIISGGAYRFVRHPIYTAGFVAGIAYLFSHFSIANAAILSSGMAVIVAKALIEERFLCGNAGYLDYMKRIRYRFIPYVA